MRNRYVKKTLSYTLSLALITGLLSGLCLMNNQSIVYASENVVKTSVEEKGTVSDEPQNKEGDSSLSVNVDSHAVKVDPVTDDSDYYAQAVDDCIIMVKAPNGTFSDNAVLSVNKLSEDERNQVDTAVDNVRHDAHNYVYSYTYDIKMIDFETKEELKPASGKTVELYFAIPQQVKDPNLNPQVFHIKENEEESDLDVEVLQSKFGITDEEFSNLRNASQVNPEDLNISKDSVAVVETKDFSYYSLEFFYKFMQYVIHDGQSVALSEILNSVGLTGEVSYVWQSNPELLSVSEMNEDGDRTVTSLKTFDTIEWITVVINNIEYVINILDDAKPFVTYTHRDDNIQDAKVKLNNDYTIVNLFNSPKDFQNGWYLFQGIVGYDDRITISGDNVHFILSDDCAVEASKGIEVKSGSNLYIYGQEKESGFLEAKSTKNSPIGGNQEDNDVNRSITINGAKIGAIGSNGAAAIGAGKKGSFGDITINGGEVRAMGGGDAAAIGGSEYGGKISTITINGGKVTGVGGTSRGAGIGGGDQSADGGKIIITGGEILAVGGGGNKERGLFYENGRGAGIGGGQERSGPDEIIISGGKVTAESTFYGAGIGGGKEQSSSNITISGGDVTAKCGERSAAIGGGYRAGIGKDKSVRITGGKVTACLGEDKDRYYNGAGIGAGGGCDQGGDIIISGGEVSAESKAGAGIGGGGSYGHSGGKVLISDGIVHAKSITGAGIGGGGPSSTDNFDVYHDNGKGGDVTISGGKVYAESYSGGSAIGGGAHGDGGSLNITDGYVEAATYSQTYDWVNDVKAKRVAGNPVGDFMSVIVNWLGKKLLSSPEDKSAAAIGGGWAHSQEWWLKDGGDAGSFTMTGGTLNARSGYKGTSAIGAGSDNKVNGKPSPNVGSYNIGDDLEVSYSDDSHPMSKLTVAKDDERDTIVETKPHVKITGSNQNK